MRFLFCFCRYKNVCMHVFMCVHAVRVYVCVCVWGVHVCTYTHTSMCVGVCVLAYVQLVHVC